MGEKGAIVLHTCPALRTPKKGTLEATGNRGQSPVRGHREQGTRQNNYVISSNEWAKPCSLVLCSPHGKVKLFQSCWQRPLELD